MECFSKVYDFLPRQNLTFFSYDIVITTHNSRKQQLKYSVHLNAIPHYWLKVRKVGCTTECAFLLNPQVDSNTTIDTYFDLLLFACF